MKRHLNRKGFTIVELMISSMVFSVILLGAATALVQIGRMYYKGVISSKTQGVARTTIDEVSRAVQFSGEDVMLAGPELKGLPGQKIKVFAVCVGKTRYTYAINAQVSNSVIAYTGTDDGHRIPHALWRDTVASPSECDPDTSADSQDDLPNLASKDLSLSDGQELLDQHMRLSNFKVEQVSEHLYNVEISVIYGDDDLLLPDAANPTSCVGSIIGGQWCAVAGLSTQVLRRIQ